MVHHRRFGLIGMYSDHTSQRDIQEPDSTQGYRGKNPGDNRKYKSDLADMEYIISQNVDIIERLESQAQKDKERKAEASIHAMKIIQAVSHDG